MTDDNIAARTSGKKKGNLYDKDADHISSQDSVKDIAEKNKGGSNEEE